MSALHQMGHHSENLISDSHLGMYAGAVLSPVNYDQAETTEQTALLRERGMSIRLFDPQLYVPTSARGKLRSWSHFPNDVDTADLSTDIWWSALNDRVAEVAVAISATAVCSPAVLYRAYSPAYFTRLVTVADGLRALLGGTGIVTYQTVVVALGDLTSERNRMEVASIISGGALSDLFLVLVGNTEPRRELTDVEELKGALSFIALLKQSGLRVTVGYCSSEMLLWKTAGAEHCASGKFFNLRRFTKTRFEEPTGGGGQLPYWFEQGLVAFLRESDLLRVRNAGLVSVASQQNPYHDPILEKLAVGEPWLGLSWRQYMHWFGSAEAQVESGALDVDSLLTEAEDNWERVKARRILMEEVANDGRWLRPWRRALAEFER